MVLKMSNEQLLNYVKKELVRCEKEKDEWTKRFEKEPLQALEWSERVFLVVAKEKVYTDIMQTLNLGTDVEKIVKYLEQEILNQVKCQSHSTSQASNMISQNLNKAKAELLDAIRLVY